MVSRKWTSGDERRQTLTGRKKTQEPYNDPASCLGRVHSPGCRESEAGRPWQTPWVEETELSLENLSQLESTELGGRKERAAQRETLRVPLESSAKYWSAMHARKLRRPWKEALERIRRFNAQHSPRPGTMHVPTASFQNLLIHRSLAGQSTQMGLDFGEDKLASGKSHASRTSTPRPTPPSSWNEPKTGRTLEASSPPMGFSLYTYYAQEAIALYDSTRLGPWLPTLCLPVLFPDRSCYSNPPLLGGSCSKELPTLAWVCPAP